MCELPPRTWRDLLNPRRLVATLAAVAAMCAGVLVGGAAGLVLIGIGAALLVTAVTVPAVQTVEFGFPAGVKVVTAVRERQAALRDAFERQRPELELVAQLLCDDPRLAAQLLDAAWARTTAQWRGPVSPLLRLHVICELAHMVERHTTWVGHAPTPGAADALTALSRLDLTTRISVVLREFADVSLVQLAAIVGRPVEQLERDLRLADAELTHAVGPGGAPG